MLQGNHNNKQNSKLYCIFYSLYNLAFTRMLLEETGQFSTTSIFSTQNASASHTGMFLRAQNKLDSEKNNGCTQCASFTTGVPPRGGDGILYAGRWSRARRSSLHRTLQSVGRTLDIHRPYIGRTSAAYGSKRMGRPWFFGHANARAFPHNASHTATSTTRLSLADLWPTLS